MIQHRAGVVASELKDDGVDVVQLMADKQGSPQVLQWSGDVVGMSGWRGRDSSPGTGMLNGMSWCP